MRTDFISVILSGGQSSRMGQDKAQLSMGKQSLLAKQYELLTTLSSPVVVSGHYPDYPHVLDHSCAQGPLAGIASVMRARYHQAKALLIIAVDMPCLTSSMLQEFLARVEEPKQCYATMDARFPLWLPLTEHSLSVVKACEHSGHYALNPFLNQLNTQLIALSNQTHLLNTNTPEQWQHALAFMNGELPHEP